MRYIAIDIDAAKVIAQDCSIVSIPTTIFYKNGKKIDTKMGAIGKDALIATIHDIATK